MSEYPQFVKDAEADAETLRWYLADQYTPFDSDDVRQCGQAGLVALRTSLNSAATALYARVAARKAFRAVPMLREGK